MLYLLVINVITFIVFGIDKYKAVKHRYRIRVRTLLGLVCIGGSLGGLLAMYLFRHKTNKKQFTIGVPFIMIMQAVLIFLLISNCTGGQNEFTQIFK